MAVKKKGDTRLSEDIEAPQPTVPGDAPADTMDPLERAVSVRPNKAAAAASGYQTVNAVVPGEPIVEPVLEGEREETYTVHKPDGTTVEVTHNYDTGVTEPVAPLEGPLPDTPDDTGVTEPVDPEPIWGFDGSAMSGWTKRQLVDAASFCGITTADPDTEQGWREAIEALAATVSTPPVTGDGLQVLRAYCAVNGVAILEADDAAAVIVKIA